MNLELPLDVGGDDLDGLVARIDAVVDEQFLREVDEALERLRRRGEDDVAPPLAG